MVDAQYAPLLQDNTKILNDVSGCANPRPLGWADSYSANGNCYCEGVTTYDHDIGKVMVNTNTSLGVLSVMQICQLLGKGPGREGRPLYNDIQCGNGPANNAGDEDNCPGRTEYGREGCKYIGPKWNFRPFLPPVKAPVKTPVKVPTPVVVAPVKVPVKVPTPVAAPVVKVPVKVPTPVAAPVKVPAPTPVQAAPVTTECGIIRLSLWNAATDKRLRTLVNTTEVCDDRSISIQTTANSCVDSLTMTLTGPNNYKYTNSEQNPPYFLFANSGKDIFGQTLKPGVYTIVVVPDGKLNLAKRVSFSVKNC